jgi:hypothetical protein
LQLIEGVWSIEIELIVSFTKYAPEPNPATRKKHIMWFAPNNAWPRSLFADIWTELKGGANTASALLTKIGHERLLNALFSQRCKINCYIRLLGI